jgi:hypothetical protein
VGQKSHAKKQNRHQVKLKVTKGTAATLVQRVRSLPRPSISLDAATNFFSIMIAADFRPTGRKKNNRKSEPK